MIKWYKLCPKMRYPIITESFIGEMLMDGNYITKEVHNEFARRIDEENTRQNRRLSALEENVKEIHGLTVSVERMAVNMENMLVAIERQGNLIEKQNSRIDEQNEKIDEVKNAPAKEQAKDSKQIKMAVITSIIGAVVGSIGGVVGALLALL